MSNEQLGLGPSESHAISAAILQVFNTYAANWPRWNLVLLGSLIMLAFLVRELHRRFGATKSTKSTKMSSNYDKSAFISFQRTYLLVFYVTQLADWLQGPTMYELYMEYTSDKTFVLSNTPLQDCLSIGSPQSCHPAKWGQGFIGTLFITGFATSSVASMFVGPLIDTYGRRLSCVVYCVLEILINTLEHSTDMRVLLFGRFLGGISTSILFVSFESWMVTEHRKRGFPDHLMSQTNAWAQIGNGVLAVVAGIICQVMKDTYGPIGPFKLAIATTATILALVLFTWDENYGGKSATSSLCSNFAAAWTCVIGSPTIMCLGLTQALFEGAMYTFVFNYVPALYSVGITSTGLVFSCLMVCVTIGGLLFEMFVGETAPRALSTDASTFALATFTAGTLAFLIASLWSTNFYMILIGFCVFETCVGAAFASMATLRGQLLPQELQGTIMNIFRVPLNMLVVIGTKLDSWYEADFIFGTCAIWLLLAVACQTFLVKHVHQEKPKHQ